MASVSLNPSDFTPDDSFLGALPYSPPTPLSPSSPGYDPDLADPSDFLQPSTDIRGGSHTLYLKLPSYVSAEINQILLEKEWGYREPQDLIRHAVFLLIRKLRAARPSHHSLLAQILAVQASVASNEYRQMLRELLDEVQKQVDWFVSQGDVAQARRFVQGERERLRAAGDVGVDGWFKAWGLREIEKRYKAYL